MKTRAGLIGSVVALWTALASVMLAEEPGKQMKPVEWGKPVEWLDEVLDWSQIEAELNKILESLAHLRQIAAEILARAQRAPGDALRDYASSVRDAYQRVSALRGKLLGLKDKLGNDFIGAVNRQIDEYNAQADAFNAFLKSPPNSVRLAMVPTRRSPKPNSSFRGNRTPVEEEPPLTLPKPAQRIDLLEEALWTPPRPTVRAEEKVNTAAKPARAGGEDGGPARGEGGGSLVGKWVGEQLYYRSKGTPEGSDRLEIQFFADGRAVYKWKAPRERPEDEWHWIEGKWTLAGQENGTLDFGKSSIGSSYAYDLKLCGDSLTGYFDDLRPGWGWFEFLVKRQ